MTVRETAIRYAQKSYPEIAKEMEESADGAIISASGNGFLAGVEYAQRWTSVEDELPEKDTTVLTRGRFDYPINVMTWDGEYWINADPSDYSHMASPDVAYWRALELK